MAASQQMDLFEAARRTRVSTEEAGHGHGLGVRLRRTIKSAIADCRLSRDEIADALSARLGASVAKTTLDTWTAESKRTHRLPAEYLPDLVAVLHDPAPLRLLVESAGYRMVTEETYMRSEIARMDMEEKRLRSERRMLEKLLSSRGGK